MSQVVGYDAGFHQVLEQQLERASTHCQLGIICGQALVDVDHKPSRGCEFAKQAVHLRPELATAWFQYGDILAQCQQYQAAIESIARGWELLPRQYFCASSIPASVQLADCHQTLGNVDASVHWWNQVLERSQLLSPFFPKISQQWRQKAHEALSELQSFHEV
ncbi:MAG: hypothetical protein HC810_05395 [Acaryochloridaceae cyanobacterium RL_2_7]|nr:hypothetical protein [Acaryochloridaceae cyanobacterium RL_2_7]